MSWIWPELIGAGSMLAAVLIGIAYAWWRVGR